MRGGNFGRYLRIDLTTGETALVPIPEPVLRGYLGGVGLGAWLLLEEAPPGIDPLAPASPLIFAFGPLVGTPLTTSAKFAVVAKSPLTGRINDALSSSHFAIAAKRAGLDALVIVGALPRPGVLVIDGDPAGAGSAENGGAGPAVGIEDGRDLQGLGAAETERRLVGRLRDTRPGSSPFCAAAIGPAGENLVRFATLSNGGRHAGRGGLGAVLGSKRLKALAIRGRHGVPLADPRAVVAAARDLSARSFGPATEKYRELGTAANLLLFNRLAVLPTRNFRDSTFEAAAALSAESLAAARGRIRSSCASCTIGCEHLYGRRPPGRGVRLEYESLFALGPLCGVADPDAVLETAALCDDLGLDTISAGGTIAFAMECAARGWIDAERFPPPRDPAAPAGAKRRGPGAPPAIRFGDAGAVLDLLKRIARREGIGHLLAEGSRRAAAIGGAAESIAPHVKGLEIPGYEPRALHAMALGFAAGTRGADHNRSSAYEADFSEGGGPRAGVDETARRAVAAEDRAALLDSLILCKFLRGVFRDLFEETAPILRAVTGWDMDAEELRTVARRVVTARKWFNEREGWTPAEDTLPERFLTTPLKDGAAAGVALSRERLRALVTAYNRARGFTDEGRVPAPLRRDLRRADGDEAGMRRRKRPLTALQFRV